MNRVTAIALYGAEYGVDILSMYEDADEYIYINDTDPDLQKWRIKMPTPPDWSLIEGFGLPPREQKFKYETYPEELKQLEQDTEKYIKLNKKSTDSKDALERKFHERMWEILDMDREKYASVISWIKNQWFHRIYGKWYFVKGKPIYLSPFHWYYMNVYTLEGGTDFGGKPEFRWRDCKWFHAVNYCYTTTETIAYETYIEDDEEKKRPIVLEDGTLKMRDLGARTILGPNCLKGRRVGDSSKTKSIELNLVTSNSEFVCGMQADTDANASGLYSKLSRFAFHKTPFYFMPEVPNTKTTNQISLRGVGAGEGLESYVTYRASGETAFDGARLNFYHGDEIGKTKNADIIKRHGIVARCLTPGVKIRGLMCYTSTAEELNSSVGQNFEDLTYDSMFEERGVDGRTKTGLVNIYFSIEESFEGFVDPWGYPIIENPTDRDTIKNMSFIEYNSKGEVMGVREFLNKKEEEFIKREDLEGLSSFQRKNPKTFKECFSNASMNFMFDRAKLQAQHAKLKYGENKCVRGDFIEDDTGYVRWAPNENGRFNVSSLPPSNINNRKIMDYSRGHYRPQYDNVYVASADTFKASKTDSKRKSMGSFAILYKHDPLIDNPDKPTIEWETKKFVCTYVYRPDTVDEFCEDCRKACVAYSAMIFPENDIPAIQEYFTRKQYAGYLLHQVDVKSGKMKESAGWTNGGRGANAKMALFNYVHDFVKLHCENIDHIEIIEELLEIPSPEKMCDFDLFVSIAGCLMGEQSAHIDRVRRFNNTKCDITGFYR